MCPTAMLARAGLLLCFVVGSRQLSIKELVVPSSVRSGENAELTCRVKLGAEPAAELIVKWWWTKLNHTGGPSKRTQLYQWIAGNPTAFKRHNIETKDNDTIVLLAATPEDSGVYECEVSSGIAEERLHGELTVFTPGTGPQLNISKVPDGLDEDTEEDVLIQCRAEDVAPAPSMELAVDGIVIANTTEEVTGPDAAGLYDVVGTVTLSAAAVDRTTVSCELFFLDTNITHELYKVAQDYGAPPTSEPPPDNATDAAATQDPLQTPTGDSCVCGVSWPLVLLLGLLTQVPSLL